MKALLLFMLLTCGLLFLEGSCRQPVHKFEGRIISKDSWNGTYELSTKTEYGKDTIITVKAKSNEKFVIGQIITIWTGGGNHQYATTTPQE